MPSITLYQPSFNDGAAIRALLGSAGLSLDGEAPPANASVCPNPRPVILVLLHQGLASDAGFEPAMFTAVREGRRIIGIWPSGNAGAVPAPFKKYSSDQVTWDASRLHKAICGRDEPAYETAEGTSQAAPRTDRNCC